MKLDRYDGEVPIFSEDYEGRERTIFGSATESNNINDQFTPEFMRGWGIVGDTEFPPLQDFNALGYTHGKLISYLYQAGIPSYTANEKYYEGSIVQYNNDIYLCTATEPTSLPTDVRDWVKWQSSLGELAQIRADKNGFLLNKAGTYNALIDTDLVQATGQSQTKIMTQKAVTDALAQKQNNLTFVGTGNVVRETASKEESLKNGGSYFHSSTSPPKLVSGDNGLAAASRFAENNPGLEFTGLGNQLLHYYVQLNYRSDTRRLVAFFNGYSSNNWLVAITNQDGSWSKPATFYGTHNTRTDKNNVLHAGTGTPINTLNVSDMNQDVINNDNLTVTSGAVYRALLSKWDIQQTTGTGNVARMSEVDKKLDTSMAFGVGQSWVDVLSQRVAGTTYTNNTEKPIFVSVTHGEGISYNRMYVDNIKVCESYGGLPEAIWQDLVTIVPVGSTYRVEKTNEVNELTRWAELR